MPNTLARLTTEFARTLRRWKKQGLHQPLELSDFSCVVSRSFGHVRSTDENKSRAYEAHRVSGTDKWDVSLVISKGIKSEFGISKYEIFHPVKGGQGLSIKDALTLITLLSPPEIRNATDAYNRPASVAKLIKPKAPEAEPPSSPPRGPAL